jgi:hypothetical protein
VCSGDIIAVFWSCVFITFFLLYKMGRLKPVFKKCKFSGNLHTRKFEVIQCEVGELNHSSLNSSQKKTDTI